MSISMLTFIGCDDNNIKMCDDKEVLELVQSMVEEDLVVQASILAYYKEIEEMASPYAMRSSIAYKAYRFLDSFEAWEETYYAVKDYIEGDQRLDDEYLEEMIEYEKERIPRSILGIKSIIVADIDKELKKCDCKASVEFNNKRSFQIEYTVQETIDSSEFMVELSMPEGVNIFGIVIPNLESYLDEIIVDSSKINESDLQVWLTESIKEYFGVKNSKAQIKIKEQIFTHRYLQYKRDCWDSSFGEYITREEFIKKWSSVYNPEYAGCDSGILNCGNDRDDNLEINITFEEKVNGEYFFTYSYDDFGGRQCVMRIKVIRDSEGFKIDDVMHFS